MLTVNCVNISEISREKYLLLRNAVSEDRRVRADRFRFIEDAKRSICAELLLQYSLFQIVGPFVEMNIAYNKFGKPFINNMKGFSYNISHSGNWVVIACGSSGVGIDIEKIQLGKEDIADKYFTEEEKNFIGKAVGDDRAGRFTQVWTLKESYIKYLGTGLSRELNSFSVDVLQGVLTLPNGQTLKQLKLSSYLFDTDYYMSACSREKVADIKEIELDDLMQFVSRCRDKKINLINSK